MIRGARKGRRWTIRSFLLLLLTTSAFPANHSGTIAHIYQQDLSQSKPGSDIFSGNQNVDVRLVSAKLESESKHPDTPYPKSNLHKKVALKKDAVQPTASSILLIIPRPILCWTAIVPIASFILINIILAYLSDQPTNKQCLVNLLYRDVLNINIIHVCLWSFGMFYCEYHAQKPFGVIEAQFIAYTNQILTLLILAYLNGIGVLRLCTVKLKQVDLLIPFMGESDEMGLRNIRCGIIAMITIIFGAEFGFSAIPPVYYPLSTGYKSHVNELPIGSIIVISLQLLLLFSCAILHLSAKVCIVMENMKMNPIKIFKKSNQNKCGQESNGFVETEYNAMITKISERCGFIIPILPNVGMMIGLAIVICIHFFLPAKQGYGDNNVSFWRVVSNTIASEGVLLPSWLIIRNKNLRAYTKKHAILICTKLKSALKRLSYTNGMLHLRRQNSISPK